MKKVYVQWEVLSTAHNFALRTSDADIADAVRSMENKKYKCKKCGLEVVPKSFKTKDS